MRFTWLAGAAIAAISTLSPVVGAQLQALSPSERADGASTSVVDAEVALIGDVGQSKQLESLLRELLTRHGVHPRFSARERLDESELLELPSGAGSGHARVWITVPSRQLARLYFADPELQRYLVREVPLRDGLDELGRERIAQVVESATLALLQGAPSLSREEVRSALRTHSGPPTEPPVERPRPAASLPDPGSRARWQARVGSTYQGQWAGAELGLLHGPGLRLGAQYGKPSGAGWLGSVWGQLRFRRRVELPEIGVDVQTAAFRLLLGRLWPLADRVALATLLGGGVDRVNNVPWTPADSSVARGPRRTYTAPWLRGELGVEWNIESIVARAAVTGDLSLYDTHYDLVRDGREERVFSPWWLRPGVEVGIIARF